MVATPKAPLVAANPSLGPVFTHELQPVKGQSPLVDAHPAENHDALGPDDPAWFVVAQGNADGSSRLLGITMQWAGPPVFSAPFPLGDPKHQAPPRFVRARSGRNAHVRVFTEGDHPMNVVLRNQRLWLARMVGVRGPGARQPDRVGAQWLEFDVAGAQPQLAQNGTVFDPARANPNRRRFPQSYLFPSIMVNGQGGAAMGFATTSQNRFLGAAITGRLAADPPGTMRPVQVLKEGEAAYACLSSFDSSALLKMAVIWGDYSYTSLDPTDDTTFWTHQPYAATPTFPQVECGNWGTWIARLALPPPP
jgi:hypothetical protein